MKRLLLALSLVAVAAPAARAADDVYVDGYTRGNGTYVRPYQRSAPDGDPYNNYGSSRSQGSSALGSGSYRGNPSVLRDDPALNPRAGQRRSW